LSKRDKLIKQVAAWIDRTTIATLLVEAVEDEIEALGVHAEPTFEVVRKLWLEMIEEIPGRLEKLAEGILERKHQ